jgi:hypothetical protein
MKFSNTKRFHADVSHQVRLAIYERGIVNISTLAEEIRQKYPYENVFDIERLVLGFANLFGCPILFDKSANPVALEQPVGEDNSGLLLDIVVADDLDIVPT